MNARKKDPRAGGQVLSTAREFCVGPCLSHGRIPRDTSFPQDVTVPLLPKPAHLEAGLQADSSTLGELFAVCKAVRRVGACSSLKKTHQHWGSPDAPAPHQDVCWKGWLLRHTLRPCALPTAKWPDWAFSTGEFPNWITISRKTEPTLSAQEARSHHVYVHVC